MSGEITHINEDGTTQMVDVTHKEQTSRFAHAQTIVKMPQAVFDVLKSNDHVTKKGSLVQTAVIAGINAVKRTAELIPLCHNIPISKADVEITPLDSGFQVNCRVKTTGQTGVEMEALTGASVAALCIYDMCKALSHDIIIGPTQLMKKTGGKRDFERA